MPDVNFFTILSVLFSFGYSLIFSVYFVNKDQFDFSDFYLRLVVRGERNYKLIESKMEK